MNHKTTIAVTHYYQIEADSKRAFRDAVHTAKYDDPFCRITASDYTIRRMPHKSGKRSFEKQQAKSLSRKIPLANPRSSRIVNL